jgi:hypothetical protein
MRCSFSYQQIARNTAPAKKDGSWPKHCRQQNSSHLLSFPYGLLIVSILLKSEWNVKMLLTCFKSRSLILVSLKSSEWFKVKVGSCANLEGTNTLIVKSCSIRLFIMLLVWQLNWQEKINWDFFVWFGLIGSHWLKISVIFIHKRTCFLAWDSWLNRSWYK